jgi:hypothetical protein
MAFISRDRHMLSLLIGPLLLTGFLLHSTGLAIGHAAVSSAITADGSMGTPVHTNKKCVYHQRGDNHREQSLS